MTGINNKDINVYNLINQDGNQKAHLEDGYEMCEVNQTHRKKEDQVIKKKPF